jgi:hypothetical protein
MLFAQKNRVPLRWYFIKTKEKARGKFFAQESPSPPKLAANFNEIKKRKQICSRLSRRRDVLKREAAHVYVHTHKRLLAESQLSVSAGDELNTLLSGTD